MSESLTRMANKIDFKAEPVADIGPKDEEAQASFQSQSSPWEACRSKLNNALSECCVLLDVVNICKKRYMVLDPVQQMAPTSVEQKQVVQLFAKKKVRGLTSLGLIYLVISPSSSPKQRARWPKERSDSETLKENQAQASIWSF